MTQNDGADVVFDTAGTPKRMDRAIYGLLISDRDTQHPI